MPPVQAFPVRGRRTANTNAVRIGKPETFGSREELARAKNGLTRSGVITACQNGGALTPIGDRRPWIVRDEDGHHRTHEEVFQGCEADDFSVASSNASATDSDDDDACYEFPAPLNSANIFSGGPTVGSPLEKCPCNCGGYFAPSDGSIADPAELACLHKKRIWLFPAEMSPNAILPLGYEKTMSIMAKGDIDELQSHYSTDEHWVKQLREEANDDAASSTGVGAAAGADGDEDDDAAAGGDVDNGAETGTSTGGPPSQSALKAAAAASPKFDQAMKLLREAFKDAGLEARAEAASERHRKADGVVVEDSDLMEAFENVAASVMNGSLDEVAEASDELKKVTIPSNVPTLILFRTPRFHRLVLWFMKHRHRGTKASYDELVDDYATVIQSVGDDVDRHPFESVATFSEEEWDSPPSESSRLHWVASIYLNLVRRWTRSFAFGRSIALHSLPLHELNGMSEFDHMTNTPGENKGGDENAVCRLARNGAIWKALREQSRCELVASWDNATGKSAISSHQLRREKSPHEGRYYYDVYDVQDYNNDDDDDDDDDDSSSDSSDEDPTPGTPRTSRTGKKRGGAGAARTPGTNRRERKKSQKS